MDDIATYQMTWSAQAFQQLVWPKIAEDCDGGKLIPVEAVTTTEMRQHLDVLAGIDAWQICLDNGTMRGIASRVQQVKKPWNTFTIRYRLRSGNDTEFQKRLRAISDDEQGWLFPFLTCHAYINENRSELLSCAVVQTRDLINYADNALQSKQYGKVLIRQNPTDGNLFIAVPWANLRDDGIWIVEKSGSKPQLKLL